MNKEQKQLLDQIIEIAIIKDEEEKLEAIEKHQGEKAIGDSVLVYHLKLLKKSIEDSEK